jgi:hypothetical protein
MPPSLKAAAMAISAASSGEAVKVRHARREGASACGLAPPPFIHARSCF